MTSIRLTAGDIIDARCTRCRAIMNHRIVAMVGDKVVKVECNTCNGIHNYYPPPSVKTSAPSGRSTASRKEPSAPRTPRRDPRQAETDEWRTRIATMDYSRALPYNMNGAFKTDNLIDHPTFGFGIVKTVVAPNKMQVLFEDGIKLLRCK